jgi:hypothetical protein
MDHETLSGIVSWRDFTDRDAHQDRIAADLAADSGEW